MKNFLFALCFCFPFFGLTQDFKKSTNYTFNDIEPLMTPEYFAVPDTLRDPLIVEVKDKSSGKVMEKIEVYSAESFCGVRVYEAEITGFKNVKSMVRVTYEFCGCCSDVNEITYLVKTNGDWIALPEVNYFTCDYPEEKPAYQVGEENHPVIQEVFFVTEYRNEQGDLYKSKKLETYQWNGKFLVKKED
ncbi:MAG: hypothetical protein ABJG68_17005 [Crocinitomicaceae bacterium]